jgi:hypothetical protein
MKRWAIVGVAACLSAATGFAQMKKDGGQTITLTSDMGQVVVPAGRLWKVDAAPPRTETGVGTADLYIDGEVFVGPSKDFTLSGHFDISFNTNRTFPIWILGNAKVRVGDSRQKLVVTELLLEPWHTPVAALESLASLARHVGEYPCSTGLLGAPVLQSAIRSVLAGDYGAYLEHINQSGCGPVAWRGAWLLLDVSQLHVGGYTSFILVNPTTTEVWVFWLQGRVAEKRWKVYGHQPVPSGVSKIIVDELNLTWGHVVSFSWGESGLVFGPPKAVALPNPQLHRTAARRRP